MSDQSPSHQNGHTIIAAAILAGGAASRYGGRPKGLIRLPDGRTIIERLITELRSAGLADIIICANDSQPYRHFHMPIIPDVWPGRGPLSGIEAAIQHYQKSAMGVLILASDLPAVTAAEIRHFTAEFMSNHAEMIAARIHNRRHQPLIIVLNTSTLPAIRDALDTGDYRIRALCSVLETVFVDFSDARPFANINTPEDLADWLRNEAT